MARAPRNPKGPKQVTTLNHEADVRRNIPTAELADLAAMQEELGPLPPAVYPRARPLAEGEVRERDEDLDPQIVWNGVRIRLTKEQVDQLAETGEIVIGDAQLVWRGKDRQDWSDLIVTAPPLYIQEKVHPKAIIDDLVRQSKIAREDASDAPDLFADFNGLADLPACSDRMDASVRAIWGHAFLRLRRSCANAPVDAPNLGDLARHS